MEKESHFDKFKNLQFSHWWFTGRFKVIRQFMNQFILYSGCFDILDIGSGYGALVPLLRKFGNVDAIESNRNSLQTLHDLGVRSVYEYDFPKNYPEKKYDVVTMFDVLEHIKDDIDAMKIVRQKLLKQNGKCFITVPAYKWLWTVHDEVQGHVRRYTRKRLSETLVAAGFKNINSSYFMTYLFPLGVLSRLYIKINKSKGSDFNETMPLLNRIFESVFSLESRFISESAFDCGLSIIAKAESI